MRVATSESESTSCAGYQDPKWALAIRLKSLGLAGSALPAADCHVDQTSNHRLFVFYLAVVQYNGIAMNYSSINSCINYYIFADIRLESDC